MNRVLPIQILAHSLARNLRIMVWAILSLMMVMGSSIWLSRLVPIQPTAQTSVSDRLNHLPLSFVANEGQSDAQVKFMVQSLGGALFFSPAELVLSLPDPAMGPIVPLRRMESSLSPGPTWQAGLPAEASTPALINIAAKIEDALDAPVVGLPAEASTPDLANIAARAEEPLGGQAVVRIRFEGANPNAQMSGDEKMAGRVNYFIGNDPARWQTDIATYAGLTYTDLYPGIDLDYTGRQGLLKSTYTIAPGVAPGQIRWSYEGVEAVEIEPETGDLLVIITLGQTGETHTLREQAPIAWQEIGQQRISVDVSYTLTAKHQVGFALGAYDPAYPLVIDPITLAYSTYLGGSGIDWGWAAATDNNGNLYVTGWTGSNNFPTKNAYNNSYGGGKSDIFIIKLDTTQSGNSSLIYSTYLGGGGALNMLEIGQDVAVDSFGNVYVAGISQAFDFPTQNAYDTTKGNGIVDLNDNSNEVVVVKLDATSSMLLYSTYLGGNAPASDVANTIAVDDMGNAYVSGNTQSIDFPTQNAYQSNKKGGPSYLDAFVTQLDTTQVGAASLVYSTYLGGDEFDYSTGIAIDGSGHIYISGFTKSFNFPTKNAYQSDYGGGNPPPFGGDAFITKLDITQSGEDSLIYSTYLGGSGDEGEPGFETGSMAIDSTGYIYVTGKTDSTDFPTKNAYQANNQGNDDVFAAKLDLSQSGDASLVYSTYIGGANDDLGYDIAVDSAGNAYMTGYTSSIDFPLQEAYQDSYHGGGICCGGDAFVIKLAAAGNSLLYGTYLGGSENEIGYGIAVDSLGNIYIAGWTGSNDFPTHNAYQSNPTGGGDAFITRLGPMNAGQEVYLPVLLK